MDMMVLPLWESSNDFSLEGWEEYVVTSNVLTHSKGSYRRSPNVTGGGPMKQLFLATDDNKMQLFHLLLNANNFHEKGHEVAVVLECASPKILIGIADGTIHIPPFNKAIERGIIDHACKACTSMFDAAQAADNLGVPLKGELSGHSDLLSFIEKGYSVLTF